MTARRAAVLDRPWPRIGGAVVHLNFVHRRYWFNNAERSPVDFAGFSGGMLSNGLVLDGVAANLAISIAWSSLAISTPCVLIASFVPASVTGTQAVAALDLDASNRAFVGLNTTSRRNAVVTGGVVQALQDTAGGSIGVRTTVGMNYETNNILQSVDGATGAAADAAATLFTPTSLRIGERFTNADPFAGTIKHVVMFNGAADQATLNARTALVHALTP